MGRYRAALSVTDRKRKQQWKARDPLDLIAAKMEQRNLIDATGVEALRRRVKEAMQRAVAELIEADPSGPARKRRIRPELWPNPNFCDVGIRGDLSELKGVCTEEQIQFTGKLETRKFIDVIAETLGRRMETDTSIVVLGEDVHWVRGGTNGATRGLRERFPGRILGTPISENAFSGLAGGMAADGRFQPHCRVYVPGLHLGGC